MVPRRPRLGVDRWASRTAGRWGLALAWLLFLAAACGADVSAPVMAGSDILVGAAISLSGSLSQEGQLTQQGYEMWASWVNAQGGVLVGGVRHRVQLVTQDDQSKPEVAASLAAGLVKDGGIQFLLGPYGSDTTAAVAAVAEQDRIPLVEGTGAAQSIFSHGYRYTFGVMSLTDQYFAGVLEMAAKLSPRPRTIALLFADDRFSQEVADSVRARVPAGGFQLVLSQQYPAGATDVTALVANAAALKPDILINSGHLEEAVAIHRAARALALNARIFAYSVGPSTPEFIADLGPDADYVLAGAQWTPQVSYPHQMYLSAAEYVAAYRSMFRTLDEPPYQTAQGTAAGLALQRALETAGSLDPLAVRNALASLDLMTFYGRLKFDSRGANVYKPMVVQQIQRSRHHTVYPPGVADIPVLYPTPPWSQRS